MTKTLTYDEKLAHDVHKCSPNINPSCSPLFLIQIQVLPGLFIQIIFNSFSDIIVKSNRRRRRRHLNHRHNIRCCCSSNSRNRGGRWLIVLLKNIDPTIKIFEMLFNDTTQISKITRVNTRRRSFAFKTIEHNLFHLQLFVLLTQLLTGLDCFVDPLSEKGLLVHHLLGLVHGRQRLPLGQNLFHRFSRWPHLRCRVVRTSDD